VRKLRKDRGHSCPLGREVRGQECPRAVVPSRSVHSRRGILANSGERDRCTIGIKRLVIRSRQPIQSGDDYDNDNGPPPCNSNLFIEIEIEIGIAIEIESPNPTRDDRIHGLTPQTLQPLRNRTNIELPTSNFQRRTKDHATANQAVQRSKFSVQSWTFVFQNFKTHPSPLHASTPQPKRIVPRGTPPPNAPLTSPANAMGD